VEAFLSLKKGKVWILRYGLLWRNRQQFEIKKKCRREIILALSPQQAATDSRVTNRKKNPTARKEFKTFLLFIIRLFF